VDIFGSPCAEGYSFTSGEIVLNIGRDRNNADQCHSVYRGDYSMTASFSAGVITKTLHYFYLLSFCPSEKLATLQQTAADLLEEMYSECGENREDCLHQLCKEAASRILAFHTANRLPDEGLVENLAQRMLHAQNSKEDLHAFQQLMDETAALPGRAAPENRLHRRKGCRFCETPCRYGYFSLVSDPDFKLLLKMLEAENKKPAGDQDPIRATWAYGSIHLWRLLGVKQGFITPYHLGNMTYCLLMLATAKSRFALPEKQITLYQAANQRLIKEWPQRMKKKTAS
jgi:hypothetical protein